MLVRPERNDSDVELVHQYPGGLLRGRHSVASDAPGHVTNQIRPGMRWVGFEADVIQRDLKRCELSRRVLPDATNSIGILLDPNFGLRLSQQVVIMMAVWYFLCFSGLIGHIANTAHTVGLLAVIAAWRESSEGEGEGKPVMRDSGYKARFL